MALFPINWRAQVTKILPPKKRSVSVIDFLTSLVHPLQQTGDAMATTEAELRLRALINSQRMVLQAGLTYIMGFPGILVETNQSIGYTTYTYNESEMTDTTFTYNESENQTPIYTFDEAETVNQYDFTVKIPVGNYTTTNINRVTAEIQKIKVSGKSFNVISYVP